MIVMHADCSFLQRQWLVHDDSGLVLYIIYIYIYIYIYSLVSTQGCVSLYMHIYRS